MDTPFTDQPTLSDETRKLMQRAASVHTNTFSPEVYFGRCIFLSWYCEKGTCDFCFRSTQKHKIQHPETARRSIGSVIAEALMIRAFGWNIEFLTGGYGIYPFEEIVRIIKVCSQVLGKPLWVNLGTLERDQLEAIRPFTQGIVSSLETLNPVLHKKVCPDKPIEPYLEMMQTARDLGFKQSFTLVIGLGETRDDFSYVKQLIEAYGFERVTVYALRPVRDTPYEKGPSTEEMVWWIATLRTTFPDIEIIAGTAAHRIPEIDLLLRAGANAFTKLPATRLFNSEKADTIEQEVKDSGRTLTSLFQTDDVEHICDWRGILSQTDLTLDEQEEAYQKLFGYLATMQKRRDKRNAS